MTSNAWLAESLIIGAGAAAIPALLLIGWALDRRAGREFHVPQHAAVGEPLPRAEMEPAEDGRGLVSPERQKQWEETAPVEHVGADEDWSPTEELALVPVRSLDPEEAAAEELRDELDRIERSARAAIARVGHAEQDTCPIMPLAELQALIDEAKAGAR